MTEQIQIAKELLRMLWRRKLMFLAVVIIGCGATLSYALKLTPLYEATAAIQIQRPQISGDLANAADSSVAERVQQIEQRLMARTNMIAVIEELGLFEDLSALTVNDKVGVLRDVTRIDRVTAPGTGFGPNGTPSALFISVTLSDARQAADTANRFVESVLELNEQKRSDLVRQTVAFFKNEETRISDAIVVLEREIATFKNRNLDALPEGLSDRRDEIGQIESAELELETRILDLEQRRDTLQSDDNQIGELGTRSPEYEELRRLEIELEARSRVLAPTHPEIRQLERQIASVVAGSTQLRDSAITREVSLIGRQIAALEKQKGAFAERRTALETSLRNMPRVTLELNALERRLEQLQSQFNVISVRRLEAETGQRLEESRQSERFVVLESALEPEISIGPSRKKLALAGGMASVIAAFAIVWLLELINPVIRTSAQMRRKLDLRPVVSIPYIPTMWEVQQRRLAWVISAAAVILAAPFAVEAIDTHVMPIEQIAAIAGLEGLIGGEADAAPAPPTRETNG